MSADWFITFLTNYDGQVVMLQARTDPRWIHEGILHCFEDYVTVTDDDGGFVALRFTDIALVASEGYFKPPNNDKDMNEDEIADLLANGDMGEFDQFYDDLMSED